MKRFRLTPHVRYVEDSGQGVLLNIYNGNCYAINGTACKICHALTESQFESDIVADLLSTFRNAATVTADVKTFLMRLKSLGLVEIAE